MLGRDGLSASAGWSTATSRSLRLLFAIILSSTHGAFVFSGWPRGGPSIFKARPTKAIYGVHGVNRNTPVYLAHVHACEYIAIPRAVCIIRPVT